jgi:thiopurine S-methyltransferase
MKQDFWIRRWENDQIGFHLDDVNPWLKRHLPQFSLNPGAHVVVPMCGKSKDLVYLAELGYRVTGIELSLKAVEDFFLDNNLDFQAGSHHSFTTYSSGNITLLHGDFFNCDCQRLSPIDLIYDRAALIAMPEHMRDDYSSVIKKCIDLHRAAMLLITMEYPQEAMEGPPFSVEKEEVLRLYERYSLSHEVVADLIGQPKFAKMAHACEVVYTHIP